MRRLLRIAALLACVLVLGTVQAVVLAVGRGRKPTASVVPRRFHRIASRVLGLRVHVAGAITTRRPTVWVCNHLSYLDVLVLGALLPARFVAKREVRRWPLFGLMAMLQRTVFVGRRPTDAVRAVHALGDALDEGSSLILFPEGTTTDGTTVAAFRSAAFAPLAERRDIVIQPITLTIRGGARTRHAADYAYAGDDVLLPHLLRFLERPDTDVDVIVHPPLPNDAAMSGRKALAGAAHRVVASPLGFVVARPLT